MSKFNLGFVKTSILSNLNESSALKGFVDLLKESECLKIELSIFDNIEKKHITNEDLAIKYIDENINLLKEKGFTKETFEAENRKLIPLIEGLKLATSTKKELYENIHTLIYESLSGKKSTNVNRLHDSFTYVLEYLKNNDKKTIIESVELPQLPKEMVVNDFLLKTAIQEFNKKYTEILTEEEQEILKSVINENKNSKETTFSSIKENTLNALNALKLEIESQNKSKMDVYEQREIDQFTHKINESINNIQKLQFNESTFVNDSIDLINLKNELSS